MTVVKAFYCHRMTPPTKAGIERIVYASWEQLIRAIYGFVNVSRGLTAKSLDVLCV